MSKFNVGDRVRVTGDSQMWGHRASTQSIWTVVTVIENGTFYSLPTNVGADVKNDIGDVWEVAEEDLELIESSSALSSHALVLGAIPRVIDMDLPDHIKTSVIKTLVDAL